MAKAVGIDFGTTNSLVAYMSPEGPKVIFDHDGEKMTPSVVSKYQGRLLVGREAKETVTDFVHGDGIREVKSKIGSGEKIRFAGDLVAPHEIAALILKKLKRNVDLFFGEDVKKAVITVPAEFSDAQRKEIMEAGKIAGFDVEKIINEPTAALMSFAYRTNMNNKTVLCYDFGGGTFDVSVADVRKEGVKVRCVGGDRTLGGSDIDRVLFNMLKKEIEQVRKCTLTPESECRLLLEIEKKKVQLSSATSVSINLPKIQTKEGKTVDFLRKLTREEFDKVAQPAIDKSVGLVQKLLKENNINPRTGIDHVLLIGGTSKIPLIQSKLTELFGKQPIYGDMDSDESVALGAALEANHHATGSDKAIGPNPTILEDVSPYSIGLKITHNGDSDVFDPIIRKNFPYGREYSETYNTIIDYQNSMYLEIYQGEHMKASKNEHICNLDIKGIPERKAGEEKVKVSFRYDQNGLVQVKATILSRAEVVTENVVLKKQFTSRQTSDSKKKIGAHFDISDEKFADVNFLNQQLRKHGMKEESDKLEKAIKNENRSEMEKIKQSLLD